MGKSIVKWVLIVPTVIGVLVLSSTLIFNTIKKSIIEDNEVLVHTVAQNLMPALLTNDTRQVEAILKSLERHSGVESAELISAQGLPMASYARSGELIDSSVSSFELAFADGDANQIHVMAPITFDSLIVANLHIAVNLWPIYSRLITWLGLLLIVPSVFYVLAKYLRLKLRFEVVERDADPSSGGEGESFELNTAVNQAMQDAGVSLEYQPIHRMTDGSLLGMEVVVAWHHPSGQTLHISPSEFVALIDEAKICLPLSDWVLHEACAQASKWQHQYGPLMLTLNLGLEQFVDSLFPQKIREICEAQRYPHQLLELEVHESFLLQRIPDAKLCLERFATQGFRLTVDNFGLSQHSLELLTELPVRKVRLDRKLVKSVAHDEQVAELVAVTMRHARSLDVQLTVEGLESSNQCLSLKRLGCTIAQGGYFSPPLSRAAFDSFLKNRSFVSGLAGGQKSLSSSSRGVTDYFLVT